MTTGHNGTSEDEKKKILIIEDDQDLSKFLAFRLKKMGFRVRISHDGEDGLQTARKERPNLIILDLRLPKFPGEEVCKAIREDFDRSISRIPIVMLTGKTSDVDRVIGNVIGANRYLTKPFNTVELLKEINSLL